MNKLLTLSILLLALSAMPVRVAAASGELFDYPTPPDSMTALQPRCDYITNRFWDRCNFDIAMLNSDKFNSAFGDWISIMQYASADSAHASIDRLIARFENKGPETLALATMAENWLYSDTSQIFSEEVYLPFARAAANSKKLSRAEKARFKLHQQQIETSGINRVLPNLEFKRPDGSTGNLGEITGGSVLIFINDPDCSDCSIARVRLAADYNANELIRRGELSVVSLLPDEATDEWRAQAATYPQTWTVGAMPDADTYFDLRESPTFIFLNSRHRVLAKGMDLDYLLNAFRITNSAQAQ